MGDEEHRLIFDFEALEIIEAEFGGLQNFSDELNGGFRGKRLKVIRVGLKAGLAHADNSPARIREITSQLVGPGFKQTDTVVTSIIEAFNQAVPPARRAAGKASSRASGSPGNGSSASPASTTSSARESSGE